MLPESSKPLAPAVPFNPNDPAYAVNPYPLLEVLRAQTPISWWEPAHSWLITRYEDAVTVLRDDQRFSTNPKAWEFGALMGSAGIPELAEMRTSGLFTLSGADHVRVRKLVSPALTPRAIERLRPEIQAIVDEVLDEVAARDTFDLVTDFAERISSRVICSMLKIPKGREMLFQRFTEYATKDFIPGLMSPEEIEASRPAVREGVALLRGTIEDRRQNPLENDILTTLIQAEEQGDRLSTSELFCLVTSLIAGGTETTMQLIGFTLYHLLQRSELFAQVRASPELLKNVIEEVLRFDHIVKVGLVRYALEDVTLSGVTIKKGQMLLMLLNSTLRDGSVFSQADTFDARRNTNPSIAFGHGAHLCIGMALARLEVQIAANALLQRFPALQLVSPPTFSPHPHMRNMSALKVQNAQVNRVGLNAEAA